MKKVSIAKKTSDSLKTTAEITDSILVKIFTVTNELIRTMKLKADTGLNRYFWNFDTKGIRQPGSAKPKLGDDELGGGMAVFPGTYKLVVELGKEKDSTFLQIKSDPIAPAKKDLYEARVTAMNRINKSSNRLLEITDRLSEAEETISKVEASLKNIESPEADSLRKVSKAMTDSIKNIRNFIFGKPLEKQGYGTPYQITPMRRLQEARGEVMGKDKIPDAQEFRLIAMAEGLVNEAVKKTNIFFSEKWKAYQMQSEAAPVKLFKAYKEVE